VGRTLVFSDHAWPQLGPGASAAVPHDQVMYVGTDSRWLARTTLRGPVASALDLCCGSGIHALLAAPHAKTVAAVDVNPRAVACTAFNARALGLGNVEALLGDLYAPVEGRTFELITANPPFVPAPAQAVGYRDGGPSGEDVQRRIVEGLPRHLAPGGIAQIVTELGEREGESLEGRLRSWLGDAPMDIHVLRVRVHPAQAYALGHAEGDDYPAYLESVDRWHANLRAQGYDRVVSVLLVFRWNDAPGYRADEVHPPAREAAQELVALLEAEALARDPALPERLRAGALMRTAPVALLEAKALGSAAPTVVQARLAGKAMPVEHTLTPLELDLLTCLDRPAPVERLLEAGAKAGLAADTVLATLISLVRKGLALPV
jgi:SAM-dependent methyltransferase